MVSSLKNLPQKLNSSLDASKWIKNPKIAKVVTAIFKCLAAMALGAGFGALTFASFGGSFIIAGTIVGALSAAISFATASLIVSYIKKHGFPAFKYRSLASVEIDTWLSDKRKKIFKQVLKEDFQNQPWFSSWFQNQPFTSPSKVEHFLWKKIQKGVSRGEAHAMVLAFQKNNKISSQDLLKKIKAKNVFHHQLEEIFQQNVHPLGKKVPDTLEDFKKFLVQSKTLGKTAILTLEKGVLTQTIYIQFDSLKFYDGCDKRYGGLHENFQDIDIFSDALFKHIRGYHTKWRPKALKYDQAYIRNFA